MAKPKLTMIKKAGMMKKMPGASMGMSRGMGDMTRMMKKMGMMKMSKKMMGDEYATKPTKLRSVAKSRRH